MAVFYAVKKGRKPGVYSTWEQCREQIINYPQAEYQKFEDETSAVTYLSAVAREADDGISRKRQHDETEPSPFEPQSKKDAAHLLQNGEDHDTGTTSTNIPTKKAGPNVTTADIGLQHVIVSTDASVREDDAGNRITGIGVYFGDHHPLNVSERLSGVTDNNIAELRAAIRAMEQIKTLPFTPKSVTLRSDSQFVINGIENRAHEKERSDEAKNLFDNLRHLCDGLNVTWTKVGRDENQEADRLAREASHL